MNTLSIEQIEALESIRPKVAWRRCADPERIARRRKRTLAFAASIKTGLRHSRSHRMFIQ